MTKRLFFVSILSLLLAGQALAASGIKGRVAWRGELVPEVRIRAYEAIADIAAGAPVAVSPPTAQDGTYRFDLAPGSYYLTARDYEGEPEPGRHFCYYSGAPVQVTEGSYTNVGFNLVRIPDEAPPQDGATAIRGEITYRDEPLERVYLYVYRDPSGGFKGPGYQIVPVEKGRFRLRLPPGEYYLLARKRQKGGRYGPIEIGDYFNYYYGNPVTVEDGETRTVRIETITRLSMLEQDDDAGSLRGVRGTIIGPAGKPAAGVRVFAYRGTAMTGTPKHFSDPSGADGQFDLPLPAGTFYLLARESFGGPAAPGERYGKYGG
nr:carboxypeptidase regulatory-like domain-containing protein [Desulfuromonadales bacterium]